MRPRLTSPRNLRSILAALLFAVLVHSAAVAQQPISLVAEVRGHIAKQDFAGAEKRLRQLQASPGVTPEWLEAFSWMGRGYLAAKDLNKAEAFASETYKLATAALKSRPLDQEPRLPIALGAAIEVLAQVEGQRGARTDGILMLERELQTYKGTSIEKRLQKNVNLLSLDGTPAPVLVAMDHLGPPPASIAEMKGKVILMFFWAHWCGDCKNQAPVLARLAEAYQDRGLVIAAPTMRFGYVAGGKQAPADEETRYIENVRQSSYPVLAGLPIPLSAANHLRYGVSTTPTLVLVDREGIIRLYHPGQMTWDELNPLVGRLIGTGAAR